MSERKPWSITLHTCESIETVSDGDDWTLNGAKAEPLLFEDATPAFVAKALHLTCEEIQSLTARLEAAEKERNAFQDQCIRLKREKVEQAAQIESLKTLAHNLGRSVISWRSREWPGTDQVAVVYRSCPELEAIDAAREVKS